ncbi:acyl-CoA thioesterase 2 [bacterium MnTg02]|nr:acyl-CoA thioesterase 2 [bacterium MnTg02]
MSTAITNLLDLLDLEPLEHNLFRGRSPQQGWQRVFGGQVIGQALVAAGRTVDGRFAHSLHGYFMRAGDPSVPIIYEVDRIRDGKSFNTRRVVAIQHGEAIFSMSVSFQIEEKGFTHQIEMPDVPKPDELPSESEIKEKFVDQLPAAIKAYWERERPIELRPVDFSRYLSSDRRKPIQNIWMRTTGPLPDDRALHQCVLAYASDFTLLDTALIAHGRVLFDPRLMLASLDHALWLHQDFRADQWLLYAQDSPFTGGARGFCRGSIFSPDGTLVGSVAQEGLIRERRTPS